MTALRTAGMVALSAAWVAVLAIAWPFIRGSVEEARRNLGSGW